MKRNLINGLVELTNCEVIMSVEQFKAYRNGDLNLLEIKMMNELDEEIGWIFEHDKKLYKYMVIGLAFLITASSYTVTAHASGIGGIEVVGNKFLDIIRQAMYWICLVKAALDIGKEILSGGDNWSNIGKVILRYTIAFATLYFLPFIFDNVKDAFAGM